MTDIVENVKLPVQKVMSILTELQIKGLVEEVSQNYYILKK